MAKAVEVSGRLARVYFTLLRSGRPLGVREVQRLAGLSGPSSAKHYLDKLVELGLAERTPEGYVAKASGSSLLSIYVGLLGSVVPRLIPYAAFSTALAAVYGALARPPIDALLLAAVPTALLWVEGLRLLILARRLAAEEGR
ncbi:MAG: helix-turn-helix domain-containing protein [Infirmifilum sp.]